MVKSFDCGIQFLYYYIDMMADVDSWNYQTTPNVIVLNLLHRSLGHAKSNCEYKLEHVA